MQRVFFDYQSATPLLPEAAEAMRPFFQEAFGVPASLHQEGLQARQALEKAREKFTAFLHAESPEEILFTGSGTEAVNLAVKGVAFANQRRGRHLVVSAIEHPAVLRSVEFLEQQGFTATRVGVDARGRVDPAAVRAAVREDTVLIAVHHVNHDLGTIEPIAEIGRMAAEVEVPLLVDAVASGGWLPLDVKAMGASLLVVSPHRFYGPKGVGVLYRNRRARLTPLIHGGRQENGLRAGTENLPAIVGAGVAAEVALRDQAKRLAQVTDLQRALWEGLQQRVSQVGLNGSPLGPERLATNLNFSPAGVEGEGVQLALDLQGVAVASGSSCLGRTVQIPPVLAAIGATPEQAIGNVIVSLGKDNAAADVERFLEVFPRVVEKLRGMSASWEGE